MVAMMKSKNPSIDPKISLRLNLIDSDPKIPWNPSSLSVLKVNLKCESFRSNVRHPQYSAYAGYMSIMVQPVIMKSVLKSEIADCKLEDHWKDTSYLAKFKKMNNFCDFTFIVKNKKFPVHKMIVGEASDVLNKMFLSSSKESKQNSTKITDITAKLFEILISFIYGDREQFEKNATKNLMFDIFEIAHKYNIKKLQDYCVAWIFKEFTSVDNVVETYTFACKYDIEELKKYCWEIIQL